MPPRQDSVFDQMKSVYDLANKAGCYDAADIIRVWMQPSKATALQGIQQERDAARSEVARLTAEVEAMRATADRLAVLLKGNHVGHGAFPRSGCGVCKPVDVALDALRARKVGG